MSSGLVEAGGGVTYVLIKEAGCLYYLYPLWSFPPPPAVFKIRIYYETLEGYGRRILNVFLTYEKK